MRELGADIVHTHNVYADLVGLLAGRHAGVRTVTTGYVWYDLGWWRNLLQALDRRVMQHFDLITAHSEDTLRRMVNLGFREQELRLLICGFESDRIDLSDELRREGRLKLGLRPGEILLANIARLHPEKNQAFLLRCFAEIRRQRPQAKLWILGVGSLEKELTELAASLGVTDGVVFAGFVPDLAQFLPLVDIQLHPSIIEGVALAVCSGMAAGLPIVATAVGGLGEVLHSGRTGILVPLNDTDAFVSEVVRLIDEPLLRAKIGAAARQFIEHDYSLERAVSRLAAAYDDLLARDQGSV